MHGGNGELSEEDLVPDRLSLIVFSSRGYIKRMTPDHFSVQVPFRLCHYLTICLKIQGYLMMKKICREYNATSLQAPFHE